MKALIFHILFNFSISESTISDINLNTVSNMPEKDILTTSAMNQEVNVSTTNSNFSTKMLAGNSSNDITDDDEECGNNKNCRLVLTPKVDMSVPVDESYDTLGKTGTNYVSISNPENPKRARDNKSAKDTSTIDPDVDVNFIKNNFKGNNSVKKRAMSYSLLFLIIIK